MTATSTNCSPPSPQNTRPSSWQHWRRRRHEPRAGPRRSSAGMRARRMPPGADANAGHHASPDRRRAASHRAGAPALQRRGCEQANATRRRQRERSVCRSRTEGRYEAPSGSRIQPANSLKSSVATEGTITVAQVLAGARASVPLREARALLQNVLAAPTPRSPRTRSGNSPAQQRQFDTLLQRRASGEPVAI